MAGDSLSKPDYFEAGLDLLASGGIGAVTISALCYRLGVTKGSFYHHFASQTEFQDDLLRYWEKERVERFVPVIEAMAPIERLEALKQGAVALRHESETAIRAWARTNTTAATTQARVDRQREEQLGHYLVEAGIPMDRSKLLARIGMSILIATQQLERPVNRKRLLAAFDEYQRWLEAIIEECGSVPVLRVVGRTARSKK
jgi:AcrR family transcriptional regulator